MKRSAALIMIAVLLAGVTALAATQAPRLAATMDAAQSQFAADEPVALTLHLANRSAGSVWLLRWQVPSEEIEGDILAVTRNGEPVTYLGPLVKRPAPTADDYVEIPAGRELKVSFDPTAVYDMTERGHYEVTFKAWQLDALTADPAGDDGLPAPGNGKVARRVSVPELAQSQAATFWFDGLDVAPAEEMESIGGYTKCTTSQIATLQTAHNNAMTWTGYSKSYLAGHTWSSPGSTYTKWFGANSSSRYGTVTTHFNLINDAFVNKSVTYNCSCKKPYYAYVYPTKPYVIYPCKVFWQAPALGRDSQMGTLVHEMSHFNVTAATDDYVYGATGAANLAISNPDQAIDNADNHEYFTEDQ